MSKYYCGNCILCIKFNKFDVIIKTMKKIKVQSRISPILFGILCFVVIAVCGLFYYLFIADASATSEKAKWDLVSLIILLGTLIGFGFKEVLKNDIYVAEFVFTNGLMQIVYKKRGKVEKVKTIKLSDILDFSIIANMELISYSRGQFLNVIYTVTIDSKTYGLDTFHVEPSKFASGCAYKFLLDMFTVSKYIPNFSYKVCGADEELKKDIEYFKIYGKRLPITKRKNSKSIISTYILVGISFFFLLLSIFFMFTSISGLSPENDVYIQNYRDIDDLRNAGNYKAATEKVEYLKTIEPNDYNVYLYEAYLYEVQGQYEKEILSANKSLTLIQSNAKSKWDEAFDKNNIFSKIFFKSGNDKYTRTYDRLATANFQLKRYKEAEIFYTKEIEYNTYKFPDVYFYRGVCRYYLGDKKGAIEDFFKQKEIYDEYFDNFGESAQYNMQNYNLVNEWIKACKY